MEPTAPDFDKLVLLSDALDSLRAVARGELLEEAEVDRLVTLEAIQDAKAGRTTLEDL